MDNGKVLTAFVAGALVGAALGILLAPEKGEVTRRKIKTKIKDLGNKAEEQYAKFSKKPKTEDDAEYGV